MLFKTNTLVPALALVAASVSAGCAHHTTLGSDTTGAEDVSSTESNLESLGTSFIGGDGQSVATQSLVAPAGGIHVQGATTVGNPGLWFQPAGCLQVTEDTANQTATYVFDGCTGPLGLVELTGTVNVSWQTAQNQLTVDLSAQGFRINRATIDDWQATAVVTASGTQRTMSWNGQLSGTTGRGRHFSRTNQKTIAWTTGVPCIAVTGQSTGNVLVARLQTTFTSWMVCADSCPQAGSEIQVKNLDNGDDIDVKYEGGATAELTIDGHSDTIGLACGD
jgi:hypothetical protein